MGSWDYFGSLGCRVGECPFRYVLILFLRSAQLPAGQIGPSDNFKKMSQGNSYLNWLGMAMPILTQQRNLGVSIALGELQCTLAAKAKRSIGLLFGLESKTVIK